MKASFPKITRRNALGLITAGAAGCLANGFLIEPGRLSITREDVKSKTLPPGLDGLRIGLLSDFHFRPGDDDALLEKVLATVADERPDLIALTGDFLSNDPGVVAPLLAYLEQLNPAHGVFAVMGNHDGWNGDRATIKRQFEQAGISFLINQHSQVRIRGETLAIAGTDFVWLGAPDPIRALRGIPSATPVLALVHEPDYFDTMAGHREITLQVSGHTHGGQCRVPLAGIVPVKVNYGKNYIHGSYSRGPSNLFVTRGVGTMGPRVRFACLPELAVLTLHAVE
ncbi:MAG: metallophosphoesterase [Akkermansiaceae bacterium]